MKHIVDLAANSFYDEISKRQRKQESVELILIWFSLVTCCCDLTHKIQTKHLTFLWGWWEDCVTQTDQHSVLTASVPAPLLVAHL